MTALAIAALVGMAASVGGGPARALAAPASSAVASPTPVPASSPPEAGRATRGADESAPLVEVLTFGPGDHPFTRFGHDAIRIYDPRTGLDLVYNFGTFAISAPGLVSDFLGGRLRYWLSRGHTAATLGEYERDNRTIVAQQLDLSPAERRELAHRLEVNALPANRDYRYDYFHDNCATRVRDALDAVLGGRLRAAARKPGSMTLRQHALRMAADNLPLYLGLLIALGPSSDQPIDQWGEDFLPEMLQATLRDVRLDDPSRPLVSDERVVFAARRAPPRAAPPRWGPTFLKVGVAAGLALYLLARAGRRWKVARVVFGIVAALSGLLLGGIGTFLLGVWLFTPHAVVYRNQNILGFAPLALAFVALGPAVGAGWRRAALWFQLVAAGTLALTLIACALKLPGLPEQGNGPLLVALLPFWTGLMLGARTLVRRLDSAL